MSIYESHYEPFRSFKNWYTDVGVEVDEVHQILLRLKSNSKTQFDAAVKFVFKAAAVDTGAIERLYETDRGFTYAVAAQVNAIEYVQNRKDETFAALFADQLKAHEYVLDAATKKSPLTQAFVRTLHEIVCASQDAYLVVVNGAPQYRMLKKGQYKEESNSVTKADGSKYFYCPVEQVDIEMQRLLDETDNDYFHSCDGVVKAAYIHHCFTLIHPFSDGNGRIARALASIFCLVKRICGCFQAEAGHREHDIALFL